MAFFESHPDQVNGRGEEVVNEWSTLVPAAKGRSDDFLHEVERLLTELMPDKVRIERKEFTIRDRNADSKEARRTCLVASRTGFAEGYGYRVYFSAKDFSNHLIVSRIVQNDSAKGKHVFDQEELSAFFSLISEATVGAAKKLSDKQDFAKMSAKSEGIMDVV